MLQVTPLVATTWPIAGDVPDLQAIIADQAETIEANEVLLHAYQGNLNTAQNPLPGPAAQGNGQTTGASNNLVVTGPIIGVIVTGATVADTGGLVPTTPPTTILGQVSGTTGGIGTYLTSVPITLTALTALTFTPPPPASTWPTPTDAPTLFLLVQQQTAMIRTQTALLQHYQDVLTTSQTAAPATGP